MRCYYHDDRDAVAVCKSCGRAICTECAADVQPGMACAERCEADVRDLNEMIKWNLVAYRRVGNAHRRNGIGYLIFAVLLTVLGVVAGMGGSTSLMGLGVGVGVVFFLLAYFSYKSGRELRADESHST